MRKIYLVVLLMCFLLFKAQSNQLYDKENALKFEDYEKQFCFKKVYEFANKTVSKESEYYPFDTRQVYKLLGKNNLPIAKKFEDFVSYSTDVKFYLLQNQNIVIAIGKPAGASSIGADY